MNVATVAVVASLLASAPVGDTTEVAAEAGRQCIAGHRRRTPYTRALPRNHSPGTKARRRWKAWKRGGRR